MKRLLAKGISIVIIVSLLLSNGWFLPIYVYAQEATQSAQEEITSTPSPTATPTATPTPTSTPTPTPIPSPSPTPTPLGTPTSSPFASDIPFEPSEQPPPLLTPTILPMQTPTGTISPTLTVPNPSAPSASIRQRRRMARLSKQTFMRSESIRTKIYNGAGSDVKIELNHERGTEDSALVAKEIIDGELIIRVDPPVSFKPGKYTLRVSDELGEVAEEQFSWGVLAINTNKSIYAPNEEATLAMAVLDEYGNMVCDAKVQLAIKNPVGQEDQLSTENGKITVNPECTLHAFTLNPDYEATYQTGEAGIYAMTLTAETKNGAQTITDSFAVQASVPFDVERVSATRIYPPVSYPVTINIEANEDFTGTVTETVPAVFEIFAAKTGRSYDSVEIISSPEAPVDLRFPLDGTPVQTLGFGEKLKDSSQVDIYQKFGLSGHDGVDYDVPIGTPVLAADGGLVVLAGTGAYGTTVVVDHPWGRSYYGHLSETTVTIGQKVLKGEQVGLSGSTGLSTGAHLHFGIKPKNNDMKNGYFGKVDPLPYLAATRTATFSVKVITWNISVVKGARITLGYEFDAPDVSPQYYLLGPLQFKTFPQSDSAIIESSPSGQIQKQSTNVAIRQPSTSEIIFSEARQWQIAADAISFTNLGASTNPDINNGTNATSYSNTSWTPPTSGLIILFVFSRDNSGLNAISSVTGNSITWTQIATVQFAGSNTNRLTLFGANASGSTTGATTISYGANTQVGMVASFFQATGVDLSGGVAAAFVQSPTNTDGGVAGTTGTVTLSAAADSNNRPISFFEHAANEDTTPRTNWTELDDMQGVGPARGVETQYRGDAFETAASATWTTSARWGGIAAEIKMESAGATLDQLMRHGNWFSSNVEQPFTF